MSESEAVQDPKTASRVSISFVAVKYSTVLLLRESRTNMATLPTTVNNQQRTNRLINNNGRCTATFLDAYFTMLRRRIWSVILTGLTVAVVFFFVDTVTEAEDGEAAALATTAKNQIVKGVDNNLGNVNGMTNNHDLTIFCLGDSLTAGLSPPQRELFPYAPSLETSLRECLDGRGGQNVTVDHSGFSGWMSDELLALVCPSSNENVGTRTVECPTFNDERVPDRIRPRLTAEVRNKLLGLKATNSNEDSSSPTQSYSSSPYKVLVYLAGTNDLGRQQRSVEDIVESITSLHVWAHDVAGIAYTIALGIPPSAYQSRNVDATQKADRINQELKKFCTNTGNGTNNGSSDRHHQWAYYVPFPIGFSAAKNSNSDNDIGSGRNDDNIAVDLWSFDGLHLSPAGYDRLGRELSQILLNVLNPEYHCSS